MDSKVTRNLIAAKALIADPEHWITGQLQDLNKPWCFCGMGAVREIVDSEHHLYAVHKSSEYQMLVKALPVGFSGVPMFNDSSTTTHADIMALFDRAIDLSRNLDTSATPAV